MPALVLGDRHSAVTWSEPYVPPCPEVSGAFIGAEWNGKETK